MAISYLGSLRNPVFVIQTNPAVIVFGAILGNVINSFLCKCCSRGLKVPNASYHALIICKNLTDLSFIQNLEKLGNIEHFGYFEI
ncbi:hypothetical protein L596_008224 [Steinernema carpocapsae]|uniref:Uncharacterized protein n=1 Tax=Steinernema carpocapsae TaxID=34508 RepID=A0A4U5PC39_STECR|nr:hypothetical protein L596_008224 [Steinernema carpocapsae]